MNDKIFYQNLQLWSYEHPKEAIWLQYFDASHLKLCKTKKEWNLKDLSKGVYYHSEKGALDEAKKRFLTLDLSKADVIFQYGAGLGYDFLAAEEWLKKDSKRRLVFLEDDLASIAGFFRTEVGLEFLNHRQCSLYFFKDILGGDLNPLFWHYFKKPFIVVPSKAYGMIKEERFHEIAQKINFDFETKNELLDEYLGYGATFYHNFYHNLPALPKSYLGNALFGQYRDVPAIICGAGPSLQKNISLLKKLEGKAFIFAGSSSLNALAAAGIKPQFGVGIDPNRKQGDRIKELPDTDFPFFYRNRLYPGALKAVKGPKLYVTGAGGYDTSGWFERRLGIEGESIEEGHNVVNFSLELAHALGCNPILFVGMDLAYTGMRLYTPGVISKDNKIEKEMVDLSEIEQQTIVRTDIEGNRVHTLWKWVAESEWISNFAKEHPEKMLINATEGGLGFEDVPNLSLKEAAARYLKKKHSFSVTDLEVCKIPAGTSTKLKKAVKDLQESLERCVSLLKILIEENRKGFKPSAKHSLAEVELAEEEAFSAVLHVFNEVYTRVLERDIRELRRLKKRAADKRKQELNEKKYLFLLTTCEVNLKLISF